MRIDLHLILVSLCLLTVRFGYSQESEAYKKSSTAQDPNLTEMEIKIQNFNNNNPTEKVFLHVGKELYALGETVFYSIHTVLGEKHHFSDKSFVTHVDLISPKNEIILAQTHEIVNGRGYGTITIPKNLTGGKYLLRSYTNWMRNFSSDFFFKKTIEVIDGRSTSDMQIDKNEKVDLQFFPEGGQLVDSLLTNVAFKAISSDGLGTKISGNVLDSKGNIVTQLNSIIRGMGTFLLRPKLNEEYVAVLDDESEFNLPIVSGSGYAMTIDNFNPDYLIVHLKSTQNIRDDPFYLLGTVRNKKELHVKFDFDDKMETKFKIPKKEIPNGVLVLTLFDKNWRAWCERLVFINNVKGTTLTVGTENEGFKKREKVTFDLNLQDISGKALLTDFSVAVTDSDRILQNVGSSNVWSYLLLESDIRGFVEQPSLLFQDQRKPTIYALDLVMLTHGWRKFNWEDILAGKNSKKKFGFSKGIKLSGVAKTTKNKPLANNSLTIWAKSKHEIHSYQTTTDSGGRFLMEDFSMLGKTEVVFNGFDSKNRPSDITVQLDSIEYVPPLSDYGAPYLKNHQKKNSLSSYDRQVEYNDFYDSDKTVILEEVTVTEDKIKKRQPASPSVYGVTPDEVVYADEYANNRILQLISRFSGVRVTRDKVGIRGGGGPLWVVDGIAITTGVGGKTYTGGGAMGGPELVPNMILNLDYEAVERVEILKGPSAAVFGMKAGHNGVILIYTKKGENRSAKKVQAPSFDIYGHSVVKEFYSPKYDVVNNPRKVQDHRSTLYWNPSLKTDEDGKATISFFNSDSATRIQVVVNGLSPNGEPITYQKTFGMNNQ